MKGRFITLEGIEGAGKTTLIQSLLEYFSKKNLPVLLTREPGGSGLGQKLRAIVLNAEEKICPAAELFLFLADRAEHVERVIKPALAEGKTVLCDRFTDSTVAYQGYGRGMDIQMLENLNMQATQGLKPDLTVLLDLDPEIGLCRAKRRNAERNLDVEEGRFEAETLDFHKKIREGFLSLSGKEERFLVVNAEESAENVLQTVLSALEKL